MTTPISLAPITGKDLFSLLDSFPMGAHEFSWDAWQSLVAQWEQWVPDQTVQDLNSVFHQILSMNALLWASQSETYLPVTEEEFQRESFQVQQMEKRAQLISLSIAQLEKKYPQVIHLLGSVSGVFEKAYDQWRTQWNEFEGAWRQSRPKAPAFTTDVFGSHADTQDLLVPETVVETTILPDFDRVRWKVWRACLKFLSIELQRRWVLLEVSDPLASKNTDSVLATCYKELALLQETIVGLSDSPEKQALQEHHARVIDYLRKVCPSEEGAEGSFQDGLILEEESSSTWFLWIAPVILACVVFGYLIWSQYGEPGLPPALQKSMDVIQKNTKPNSQNQKAQTKNDTALRAMMANLNLEIPVYALDETRQMLLTQELDDALLERLGETMFVFAGAEAFYLFWESQLQTYEDLASLESSLLQLMSQYEQMVQALKTLRSEFPAYQIELEPFFVNNLPAYALILKQHDGFRIGEVVPFDEGLRLTWRNSNIILPLSDPERLVHIIQNLE